MTGFVGIVEVLFSRFMHKLRFLFPPEVTGTVVTLVGLVIIPISVKYLVGIDSGDTITQPQELFVGLATLVIMIGLNVFSKGKIRLYGVLISIITGYLLAYFFGLFTSENSIQINNAAIFGIPYIENMSWNFDPAFIIPFSVAALCSTLKTVGDIATCQKINDAEWKRVDMKTVSGGIFADGLGGIVPALIGGFGQSTSSSNIGLSLATGATSRRIAFAAGIIFILLAFFPKLASVFIIMPKPVMGATLIFAVSFMIVQGLQIMTSRMLDARKIFVIGAALVFGLSADMVPEIYQNVPHWIQPLFSSSLSLGSVTAVVLNLVLSIGISKHSILEIEPDEDFNSKIFDFMETKGSEWGARKEVIFNAASAMNEVMESISGSELTEDTVKMKLNFDEFMLDVNITYRGKIIEIPQQAPSKMDIERDEYAFSRLSAYLIKQYSDKVKTSHKNGQSEIKLYFEH
jgi:NCS2 family nucleobase:cation symporter-2